MKDKILYINITPKTLPNKPDKPSGEHIYSHSFAENLFKISRKPTRIEVFDIARKVGGIENYCFLFYVPYLKLMDLFGKKIEVSY